MDTAIASVFFFFNDTATNEIYTYFHTRSLHVALPIWPHLAGVLRLSRRQGCGNAAWRTGGDLAVIAAVVSRLLADHHRQQWLCRAGYHAGRAQSDRAGRARWRRLATGVRGRSEEHTSELQSLMRISYAVFYLQKKNKLPA